MTQSSVPVPLKVRRPTRSPVPAAPACGPAAVAAVPAKIAMAPRGRSARVSQVMRRSWLGGGSWGSRRARQARAKAATSTSMLRPKWAMT